MGLLDRWFRRKPFPSPKESISEAQVVPANWAGSPTHLALLERFLSVRDAKTGVPDFWAQALGIHPERVIDGMLALGLLESASLLEKVEFGHTGAELKKMLSSRGLKVSGKKAEQTRRLIEADPDGMEKLCSHRKLVRCTPSVSQVVLEWLAKEAESFNKATDDVILALRLRQFKTAVSIADVYRNSKFNPPVHPAQDAMTIKSTPRPMEERAADLAVVFTMRPKILNGLKPEQWDGLYLSYAVWQLLGRAAPNKCMPGFTGIGAMDSETVMRMLGFYIDHQRDLARWHELGIKRGTILCCNAGSCDMCKALDKKIYRLDKLPELPYKGCTCALGCRCYVSPDLGVWSAR
jgi:hypothetical protein